MSRTRRFLLRDKELTSCGNSGGGPNYAYFCPVCGEVWGKVETGGVEFVAVTIPCTSSHNERAGAGRIRGAAGSFLKPLLWWDPLNGNTLERQLNVADEKLLRYEAERATEWVLNRG